MHFWCTAECTRLGAGHDASCVQGCLKIIKGTWLGIDHNASHVQGCPKIIRGTLLGTHHGASRVHGTHHDTSCVKLPQISKMFEIAPFCTQHTLDASWTIF